VSFIPLSVPTLNGKEAVYINQCLETNWVSSAGTFVDRFGKLCAEIAGARFGIPVVNGTAALHLAVVVAGIKPDEEVIIPSLTFIGTAVGVRHAGAHCAVLDVDPVTWQLDPARIEEFLRQGCERKKDGTYNKVTKRKVTGIMPVHLLGHPCDMDPIMSLAEEFGLFVIEDAAEAVGAAYKGRLVGGIGRMGCFSFNGNKTFTCGGGGAIVTNDEALAKRAEYLSTQAKDDPVLFIHKAVGYNYRLTNLAAAMGVAQLEERDAYFAKKAAINARYRKALDGLPGVTFMGSANWADNKYWLTTVRINRAATGTSNLDLMRAMEGGTAGGPKIQTRLLWQPMHHSPALEGSFRPAAPVSDAIYEEALSLPSSVSLTDEEQDHVVAALKKRLAAAH
jgi:perosamine synthetase